MDRNDHGDDMLRAAGVQPPQNENEIELDHFAGDVTDLAKWLTTNLPAGLRYELAILLEGAKTKRQTGMEATHERWVLATLNFLHGMDIPVWNHGPNGVRLGQDKEIPERLSLVTKKIAEIKEHHSDAVEQWRNEKRLRAQFEKCLWAIESELADDTGRLEHRTIPAIIDIIATAKASLSREPRRQAPTDERGVTRHTVDASEAVLRLGISNIVHDVAADEKICPECLGLGLLKCDQPYGTGERKPREDAFPYHHQWLAPCHVCYLGKVAVCVDCKQVITPRGHLWCTCTEATAKRAAVKAAAEAERRKTLPRVKLEDYQGDMVWCDEADRFIMTDAVEDHLEDYPDEVFFACEATEPLMIPDAEQVIEELQNNATSEASPEDGDEVLDFNAGAQAALAESLTEWAQRYVTSRRMWYSTSIILEVPRPEAPPPDLLDSQSDPP